MFYVNDEPEGKFLYTETIKLYCIVNKLHQRYSLKKKISWMLLYVHRNRKVSRDFTQLLSSDKKRKWPTVAYIPYISGTLGDTGLYRHKTEPIFIQGRT